MLPATELQVHLLTKIFNVLDHNKAGYIVPEELTKFTNALGLHLSTVDLKSIVKKYGEKDKLNFEEFTKFIADALQPTNLKDAELITALDTIAKTLGSEGIWSNYSLGNQDVEYLTNIFNNLDKDKSGFLKLDEVSRFFSDLGNDLSSEEAVALVLKYGSMSGVLDLPQFLRMMEDIFSLGNVKSEEVFKCLKDLDALIKVKEAGTPAKRPNIVEWRGNSSESKERYL